MTTFAWVIEQNPGGGANPSYWDGRGIASFTHEHEEAIRFARQQDAMTVMFYTLSDKGRAFCRVTEHGWGEPTAGGVTCPNCQYESASPKNIPRSGEWFECGSCGCEWPEDSRRTPAPAALSKATSEMYSAGHAELERILGHMIHIPVMPQVWEAMIAKAAPAATAVKAEDLLRGLHKAVTSLAPYFDKAIDDKTLPLWLALDSAQKAVNEYHAAPAVASGWRPIAEAPRDGTGIWLYQDERFETGSWDCVEQNDWDGRDVYDWCSAFGNIDEPTHWLPLDALPPLPSPPTEGGGE